MYPDRGGGELSSGSTDRLVHLGFDLFLEHDLAAFEDFLDVRLQFARVWIDDREFFLDAEGEPVAFAAHRGAQMCVKNMRLSSNVGAASAPRQIGSGH